uniref:Uncharacterized protein n=1 Tax=Aegilops tauschii subsp. strangulata TaxID=200361 RepID=A0A453L5Q5_AEGTS
MTFHYFISVSEIHIDGLCLVFLFTEFRFAVLLCFSFSLPCLMFLIFIFRFLRTNKCCSLIN